MGIAILIFSTGFEATQRNFLCIGLIDGLCSFHGDAFDIVFEFFNASSFCVNAGVV